MGKGKGGDTNAFYRFIDESYFAFWFRQWAAFFIVVGILLIIAGAVVYGVYPNSQSASFAQNQLISSPDSANYANWASKTETLNYTFHNLQVGSDNSVTCTPAGPYVFDLVVSKASVTFNGNGTISYQLNRAKTFRPSDSAPPLNTINLINPSYAALVQKKSSEQSLLLSAILNSTFVDDLHTFTTGTAAKLVGARHLSQIIPTAISQTMNTTILPAIFGNLNQSVTNYEWQWKIAQAMIDPCQYCNGTDLNKPYGIFTSMQLSYLRNPSCGGSVNVANFLSDLVNNFSGLTQNTACSTYLKAHAWTASTWSGVNSNIITNITLSLGSSLDKWYDTSYPLTTGYCANRAAAASTFGVSVLQIGDICDVYLKTFFDGFTIPAPTIPANQLGLRAFCTSASDSKFIFPAAVPTKATVGVTASFTMGTVSSAAAFNDVTCKAVVSALADVNGFTIPLYYRPNVDPGTHASVSSLIPQISAYIQSLTPLYHNYFAYTWVTGVGYPGGSQFQPFSAYSNSSSTVRNLDSAIVAKLFFPSSATVIPFAFVTNPLPVIAGSNIFSTIIDASGILNYLLNLNQQQIIGNIGLGSAAPYYELTNYASKELLYYISTLGGISGLDEFGYTQFAHAQYACGINPGANRCSVAKEFFGVNSNYYAEYGIASYVTVNTPSYFRSFTTADQSERDTADYLAMINLFGQLADPTTLINGLDTPQRRYLYFLLSTFIRAQKIPSSSGIIASRTANQWINGLNDATVVNFDNSNPLFGFDMDGNLGTYLIDNGAANTDNAYRILLVNGQNKNPAYPSATIVGALNSDAFSTGVAAGSTVQVYDYEFGRAFDVVMSGSNHIQNIDTVTGVYSINNWKVDSTYKITSNNLMPSQVNSYVYYSPCDAAPATTCPFPTSDSGSSSNITIDVDLGTGLVVGASKCIVFSFGVGAQTYPFTGFGLAQNAIYSSVRRVSTRQITTDQSQAFQDQFTKVQSTAQAVLLALVIVGGLFVLAGATFLIFWLIRRNRKMSEKAEMDLVEDPFNEKNKNIAKMKY